MPVKRLNITGGSLNIVYVPSADSTPISAQFSAGVSLGGDGSLSVHTLQVDAAQTFTVSGGSLAFNRINLMPHSSTPATLLIDGDVVLNPLDNASAIIANGAGTGASGLIDLGGATRTMTLGDGAAGVDLTISVPLTNGGLSKSGPGMMRLTSSDNTYAGDTIVEEGTLKIYSPFLSDSADLYLSTGGLLELSFGGSPDVIDSLFIDGVAQPVGVWGGPNSGAQFTTPLLAGFGLLEVTSTIALTPGDFNGDGFVNGDDLLQWQADYGTGDGSDADGDGDTDGADYLIWQRNFTGSLSPLVVSTPVPEMTTLQLVVVGLAMVISIRR